jgi:predicted nucleic acid-binding protein
MLIADTGFFVALADRHDEFHRRAVEYVQGLREPLVTTWPILSETSHFLSMRVSHLAGVKFLEDVAAGAVLLHPFEPAHLPQMCKLMKKYADLPMDLADASLVLLAEQLNDGRILSTDRRDFKTYRFKNHKPFRNVLLPD